MTTVNFRVAMLNDGQIGLFASGDVDPALAKRALEKLIAQLGTDQIKLVNVAPIERHDDQRIQQVHDLTHNHN